MNSTTLAPSDNGLLSALPDELLWLVLWYLDVPDLLMTSRTSRRLRSLSFDRLLHRWRILYAARMVGVRLAQRPDLSMLQPPLSHVYLTRTHIAARRLHWSLVCIRLNRSLARRPKASTLLAANILPKECCKVDRRSGEITYGTGVAGPLVEPKRKVEREQIKQSLRVWLERKAREIRSRKYREDDVGVLVWRFSRKMKLNESGNIPLEWREPPKKESVSRLKRFWENMAT